MSTDTSEQKKSANPFLTASGILGGVIGFYCGLMLFVPFAGAAIGLLLARHFASETLKPFTAALAVIFGHLAWMLIGVLFIPAGLPQVIPDMVIIVAGLLWLVLRPGLGPVILLGIYEGISLVVNVVGIFQFEYGTAGHKALTAHIALRLFALASLITGYRQFRKNQAEPTQMEVPPPVA
jgi:hypothetical protein